MVKEYKKVIPIRKRISQELDKQIKKAMDTLNETEKFKVNGLKKKTWTYLETSHELGKYLNTLRNKNN